MNTNAVVIQAQDLQTHFALRSGVFSALTGQKPVAVRALDGVDLTIRRREVVGLIGESGCGKSTLGMSLVRMYQPTGGKIRFFGDDITDVQGAELKSYRHQAQLIFQDPYSSLNPRLTIGEIVEEPLRIHRIGTAADRARKVAHALDLVRVPASEYLHRYPNALSGGQRQRIAIARALVLEPKFIVADEPVSMLDVSIQASVLEILDELSKELGLAVLYISHDIATVGYICDHVAVMYLGQIVEEGPAEDILTAPRHPYTQRLMAAIPSVSGERSRERVELSGDVPSPLNVPPGCRFSSRCPYATDLCRTEPPALANDIGTQRVRCHLYSAEGMAPANEPEMV
ncbi:ATP-binding cassette domain-containing protein [Salipiger sp. 1_MG-2023]|uniref:ABC transporter ATP-binding protein n=1 Tax=Salipiger sp. 1_MG-2023 TaxID=3062665 RepID=UPI0026E15D3F|nr:oligopeptide/dipeptide ABC transporter ATP-binding protein [Salipiger sp. 1_MG-2023]MDO6584316.1 ATP-binding cassette domain-containing protein [Salipiger sp. 1_MG-2023]